MMILLLFEIKKIWLVNIKLHEHLEYHVTNVCFEVLCSF